MGVQGDLVTNGSFETYTGTGATYDLTGWDETRTNGAGAATVEEYTALKRFGAASIHLQGTAADSVAKVVTSAAIAVTKTLHYVLRFNHYKLSGGNNLTVTIIQYNSSHADLTDNIVITPSGSAAWGLSQTVIHPAAEGGNDWHANCAEIKIQVQVTGAAASWLVDGVIFAASEGNTASAFGTKLFIGGYEVAELQTISGPSMSADAIDATSHDSPNEFREFIAGVKDGGEISIEGNLVASDANGQVVLEGDVADGGNALYHIILPSAEAEWLFNGYATAWNNTAPFDDKLGFSATIKVTGKPVLSVPTF